MLRRSNVSKVGFCEGASLQDVNSFSGRNLHTREPEELVEKLQLAGIRLTIRRLTNQSTI